MGERSRFSLPSLGAIAATPATPNVDEARSALGGRVSTGPGAGTHVHVTMSRGPAIGVVVCALGDERDVWIGEGRLVRVKASDVSTLVDEDPDLASVSRDVRAFAAMREGDTVIYTDRRGARHEGALVEKCRYGALVAVDAGRILAVSFRRLSPTG